jgi:acetylornithine deacetylase/succinyl-diaminopimelate desuccinylase-like protein
MVETDAPAAFATSRIVMWLPRTCRFGLKFPTYLPRMKWRCKRILGLAESSILRRGRHDGGRGVKFVPIDQSSEMVQLKFCVKASVSAPFLFKLAATTLLCAALGQTSPMQTSQTPTADLLSALIRIDTSNPPGNESKVAEFLAARLRPLGFDIQIIATPEEGKAHFIARLKGDGSKKPVLLAAHADVVGVEREKWTTDPFAGTVRDGYVYGRGAIDFKGGLAVFAAAVIRLARNHVPLHRDVILLSEADEESGRYNTSWLADSHWELIDCEFALNEGGWIIKNDSGEVQYLSVSTADKLSIPLTLTASGTSTHSSMPIPDNPILTLSKALAKLADFETPLELTLSTREFFETLAKTSGPPLSDVLNTLLHSKDPKLVAEADRKMSENPLLHALARNTIAPVILKAGFRGNVIPGSAQATVNLRLIPGTDFEALVSSIRKVINDPRVDVSLNPPNTPEGARAAALLKLSASLKPSPKDTTLYRALEGSAHSIWPQRPVTTYLFQAGTDAIAWRSRGIPVYGIYPYPITADDLRRMHGNDERVPIQSLEQGTELIYKTLVQLESE